MGCRSNSDCAPKEACHNTKCVDPCNCGPGAYCEVIQHTPLCYCPEGYSGNPLKRCNKRKEDDKATETL